MKRSGSESPRVIEVGFQGQMLQYRTRRPGQATAESVIFEFQDLSSTPLELWNGDTKLSDETRVGRCKKLHLKPTESPSTSTPPRDDTPPHHKLCSPGDIPMEAPFLRPRESYELGMRQGPTAWNDKLEVFLRDDGERGVRALVPFRSGKFVCEFEANLLSREESEKAEKEYMREDKPVYTLQAHGYYFDPTLRPNVIGKYINHAAKGANITLLSPIEARGKVRIGFVSIKNIEQGEELFFDYGFRDSELPWTYHARSRSSTSSDPTPPSVLKSTPSLKRVETDIIPTGMSPTEFIHILHQDMDDTPSEPSPESTDDETVAEEDETTAETPSPLPVEQPTTSAAAVEEEEDETENDSQSILLLLPVEQPTSSAAAVEAPTEEQPLSSSSTTPALPEPTPPPSKTPEQTPSKQQKKGKRIRRPCPIPECRGSLHLNLWNHIFQTHKSQGKYSMEELKQFMEIAKLAVPTTRKHGEPDHEAKAEEKKDTVKEEEDGTVSIVRIDFQPTSSGRERFGSGTVNWQRFSLDEPVLKEFCSYLQSVQGGTKSLSAARQETVDLSKFLYLMDSTRCDLSNVSYTAHVIKYMNELRSSRVGPSGTITKLTTLCNALSMALTKIPDEDISEDDRNLVTRAKLVETKIHGLQKSLRREGSNIRLKKKDLFSYKEHDMATVLKFLQNKQLMELVTSYIAKDTLTDQEHLLARRFLMCSLLYTNAQRQGPVCNLKVEEQARATHHTTATGGSVHVYKVWEHKTSGQFGAANLVVPDTLHQLINGYAEKHRPTPQEDCKDVLFLTPGGRRVAHLSEELRALSKDFPTELGVINITATEMRKLTSTKVATECGDEATVRNVATHMTHTPETARRFYQHLQGQEESVAAYATINPKRSFEEDDDDEPKLCPRTKRMRQQWLPAERDVLAKYFALTSTSKPPKQDDCAAFLLRSTTEELFVHRTKKDIQDKVRTIIKQLKKGEEDQETE